MSLKTHICLAVLLACAHLSLASALPAIPTKSELSRDPARVAEWARSLMTGDANLRSAAEAALVQGGRQSLPLLEQIIVEGNDSLSLEGFEILRRVGPPAIPLLAKLLRNGQPYIRRKAVDSLIDLAPETERVQAELRSALADSDSYVARDAARALGALGYRAASSVSALVKALSHEEPHVRIYAAEALASIGPGAVKGTAALGEALSDTVPGVRWAAGEALASIGPGAVTAVPELSKALEDEFLYVRICAANALGSIGPKAKPAVSTLEKASTEPGLRKDAEWALNRITGVQPPQLDTPASDRTVAIATQSSIPEPAVANPPADWDPRTGKNILWSVELGNETFGRPVVARDAVFVGTDNARRRNPACQADCGVLAAFRASDGAFLWQDLAPRVPRGLREFLLPSTTSAPCVEENRLYYVTAECQLRCLDTEGFSDGKNNGPYRDESFRDRNAADLIWELDMCGRLGVFPHEASNSEAALAGDLIMVGTSNGQNEGHTRVPSPRAPSLIAVDKHSGEVVWTANGAGDKVLHGQWCSPVVANVNGRTVVLFGGGDGWLRAYDAASGLELWRFDANPKDARWLPRPGVRSRDAIIAPPVLADGRVFVALGQDPLHGNGPSWVHALNADGRGDVTESKLLWSCGQVGRVVGTPVVHRGLLYLGDLGGTVHCLNAATGAHVWRHETNGAIWGCLALCGEKLYVGNVEGEMNVFRTGPRKELLAHMEMDAPLYSRPMCAANTLYLATAHRLYCIAAHP